MLYPTLNQPLVILMTFLSGFTGGLMFDVAHILTLLSGKDKYSKHILEFVATILSAALLFLTNLHFNFGQFRLYVLAVFFISFSLQRIIARFLWTKLLKKWYSIIVQRREERAERKKQKID